MGNPVRKLLFGALFCVVFFTNSYAQVTFMTDGLGMPVGIVQTIANMNYYSTARGMPVAVETKKGNTSFYSDGLLKPIGTSYTPTNPNPLDSAFAQPGMFTSIWDK